MAQSLYRIATAFLACALAATCAVASQVAAPRPHIIQIVADDMGSNDASWSDGLPGRGGPNQNAEMPNLHDLAMTGVRLGHFYTFKMCAPSRAMILTGRYTFHFGYYNNDDADTGSGGVPTALKMTPYDLKKANYTTAAFGKWHCGFRTKEQTPPFKGFDHWLGYFHAEENYFTQKFGAGPSFVGPDCAANGSAACCGTDFTESEAQGRLRASPKNGSASEWNTETPSYSTYQYAREAVSLIEQHDPDKPLYIYLPFQNVHGPVESPPRFKTPFVNTMHPYRRKIAACLLALDEAVGNITAALKRRGMYNNSVITFQSDNGGPEGQAGLGNNNYPLIGGKWTLWEGGVRVIAFVHSQLLPPTVRGTVWNGMMHATDWRPTFAGLAGVTPDASGSRFPLDGQDVWSALASGTESPRTEVVHTVIKPPYNNKTCSKPVPPCFHKGHVEAGAAIRQGRFKLVVGYGGFPNVAATLPNLAAPFNATSQAMVDPTSPEVKCADHCLFDVVADPSEQHDIKLSHPEVVRTLQARLDALASEALPRLHNSSNNDPRMCQMVAETGYFLPYQDS